MRELSSYSKNFSDVQMIRSFPILCLGILLSPINGNGAPSFLGHLVFHQNVGTKNSSQHHLGSQMGPFATFVLDLCDKSIIEEKRGRCVFFRSEQHLSLLGDHLGLPFSGSLSILGSLVSLHYSRLVYKFNV